MPTLNWIGKDKVINHHAEVPFRVLEHKYGYRGDNLSDTSETHSGNKIIHGDNLEALKALLPEYEGKIDCIYIDPPYNTGNEGWVYNDNVNDPHIKKWLGEVVGREGEDMTRHDKWLCMMYPRLRLLQMLLSPKGAIFISIDFHEQPYLRILCDEIFCANNFVAEIACVNKPSGRSDDKYIATAHESILIYRKSSDLSLGGFPPEDNIIKRYTKKDEQGRLYREEDLRKRGTHDERTDRPNLFYPFFFNENTQHLIIGNNEDATPNGYIRIVPMKTKNVEGTWRWGKETASRFIHLIHPKYMPNKSQWTMFEWQYLDERDDVKPTSLWNFKDVNSERGTEMLFKKLLFDNKSFQNPKPVGTIQRIVKIATQRDSVVLDSFGGSGTTAQAVMQINKDDNGKRKFIVVEMMDYADSLTAERVKRVISGTNEFSGIGGSFDYYELGEPLFKNREELNENIGIEKMREYIYYTETHEYLTRKQDAEYPYLLDYLDGTGYFFYYEPNEITTLSHDTLGIVPKNADNYVIYADVCTISKERLAKMNITFKKIPRDISKF